MRAFWQTAARSEDAAARHKEATARSPLCGPLGSNATATLARVVAR